jgi:hypothetical protein
LDFEFHKRLWLAQNKMMSGNRQSRGSSGGNPLEVSLRRPEPVGALEF